MKIISIKPFEKQIRKTVETQLTKLFEGSDKLCNNTLNLNISFKNFIKKQKAPVVRFTPTAWLQMNTLVQSCDKEIAAHGIVKRNKNTYTITEIIVYPQEITGATVQATDDYGPWLMDLPDNVFDNLRFQFHSHVNMMPSPSGVDLELYETLTKNIKDFYIFMIMNKRNAFEIFVYDIEKNCIFETKDIEVEVALNAKQSVTEWYKEVTKKNIKEKKSYYYSYAKKKNNSVGESSLFDDDDYSGYYHRSILDDVPDEEERKTIL